MAKELTAGERIRRRKVCEDEFLAKWKNKLNDPEARLDLFRFYYRRGVISLAEFRRIKAESVK